MRLGDLGKQIVLKSLKAFESLKYLGFMRVNSKIYYPMRKVRDNNARKEYFKMVEKDSNGTYIKDLIEKELMK